MSLLSTILAIAGAVVLIAAVAYFIVTYLPYIINFFNSITEAYVSFTDLIPDWLLPFAFVPIILFVIGVLIKLL